MATDSFDAAWLVLPENEVAVTALQRLETVRHHPTGRGLTVCMAYVWGASGVGKSHLLRDAFRRLPPEVNAAILTAAAFGAEFAESSDTGTISDFQDRYRQLDLLVLEDLHLLSGRHETQSQLVETIDAILAGGGAVICSGAELPGAWQQFSPRLKDRLRSGITAHIRSPGLESRTALVRHFAASRQWPLSDEAAQLIARTATGSTRELKAMVQRLELETRTAGRFPSVEVIKAHLRGEPQAPQLSISRIARRVGSHFGVTVEQLRSASRAREVADARQLAMFLTRELSDRSLAAIGDYFGRRNHTTVMHAQTKVAARIASDPTFAATVDHLLRAVIE